MALLKKVTTNGTVYPKAYSRVIYVLTYKDEARIFVNTYEDADTRASEATDNTVLPILQREYVAPASAMSGDQFPQAYTFLKTQDDFDGAYDC